MHRKPRAVKTALHWLLLSLLLAVQCLAHAHEYSHIDGSETTLCSICSVNGSPAHSAPTSELPVLENHAGCPLLHLSADPSKPCFYASPGPRAPPSDS